MKNHKQYTLPTENRSELAREIMINLNQWLYDEGQLTHEIYRVAKERFLTMKLDNLLL